MLNYRGRLTVIVALEAGLTAVLLAVIGNITVAAIFFLLGVGAGLLFIFRGETMYLDLEEPAEEEAPDEKGDAP